MTTSPVTPATRALVRDRSAGFCEVCGTRAGENIHHRAPRGMGGTKRDIHTAEWLLNLCGSGTTGCHGYIESHRDEAYEKGWLLRRHSSPRTIPAWLYGHVFAILTPEGGYDLMEGTRWLTGSATADTGGGQPEPLF